jgi:hypothetical protein
MSKLMLLSIMIATIALPARASRTKNPRAGFKKTVVQMLVFEAIYVFCLKFLNGRV